MADNFNEQELQALFNRHLPHRPMPPEFAERLKQQVLAEVANTLQTTQYSGTVGEEAGFGAATPAIERPLQTYVRQDTNHRAGRRSGDRATQEGGIFAWLAERLRIAPSLAMAGATLVALWALILWGPVLLEQFGSVVNPQTGSSGNGPNVMPAIPFGSASLTPTPTVVVAGAEGTEPTTASEVAAGIDETTIPTATLSASPTPTAVAADGEVDETATPETTAEIPVESTVAATGTAVASTDDITTDDVTTEATRVAASRTPEPTDTATATLRGTATSASATVPTASPTPAKTTVMQPSPTATPPSGTATRDARVTATARASSTATATALPSVRVTSTTTRQPAATATPDEGTGAGDVTPTPTLRASATPTSGATRASSTVTAATATPTTATIPTKSATQKPPPTVTLFTPVPTLTPTSTDTSVPTATPKRTIVINPVPTHTPTPSNTRTPTLTNTPLPIPTNTPTPTNTNTPLPVPTNTSTPTNTNTPLPTPTNTLPPTNTPVPTPTDTLVPTNTPVPTATNTPVPTATNTQVPTDTPAPTDTPVPTNTPVPTDTPIPTPTNRPPVASDVTYEVREEQRIDVPLRTLVQDPDGDPISIWIAENPVHGALVTQDGNIVAYIPEPNYNGLDSFVYVVSDGTGEDQGRVTLQILPDNDPPTIRATDEPQFATVGTEFTFGVEATDIDPGDTLTISLDPLSKPNWLAVDEFGNGLATLRGVPNAEDVGFYEVVIVVVDSAGAEVRFQFSLEVIAGTPLSSNDDVSAAGNQTSVGTELPPVDPSVSITGTASGE